jgi:hypothetical protein
MMAGSMLPPTTMPVPAVSPSSSDGLRSFLARFLPSFAAGIGTSLGALGTGQANWGQQGAQAITDSMAQQRQAQEEQLRNRILQSQFDQQQQDRQEQQQRTDAARSWLLGQKDPGAGFYNGQGRPGPSVATPGALDNLPASQRDYFRGMADVDPVGTMQLVGQEVLNPPKPEAPITNGGMQYDPKTGTWADIPGFVDQQKAIADAQRAPVQPPQLPADYYLWAKLKSQDPTTPGYTAWKLSLNAPQITYGAPVTGDAAKSLGFDPNGSYQQGSDGKWYVAQAPLKPTTTYGDLITGDQAKALGLDPTGSYQRGSDGKMYVLTAPKTPQAPQLVTLVKEGQQPVTLDKQSPQLGMYLGSGWTERQATGATVNMPPLEKQFDTKLGGAEGEAAGDLLTKIPDAAQAQLNNIDALKQAIGQMQAAGTDTGALASVKNRIGALAQAFGMDPSTFGLPADAGPGQLLTSLTNQLALQARSTSSGTGMPGAMSDSDRAFLQQSVPNIGDTPMGIQAKITIAERLAQRQLEGAQMFATKYPHTQAGYESFLKDWRAYNQQNPVFSGAFKSQATGQVPPVPTGLADRRGRMQYSPSRDQWRDKQTGEVFDANGNPVQP